MSLLTDTARPSTPPAARRATRRAHWAPFVSAGFAAFAAVILFLFAYQAGFFEIFAREMPKPPVKPAQQTTVSQSTITGFDTQNRPYSVSARSAIQDKDVPSRVHLKTVSGESRRSNGETVTMKADTGLYDTEAKELDLSGAVEISSGGRFIAHMDKARVVVREKKLISHSAVTVELPDGGTIQSKALEITNDGDNVRFFNGVRAKFKSKGSKGDGSP